MLTTSEDTPIFTLHVLPAIVVPSTAKMLRLEEQFSVVIDADTIAQLISVPEICKYLEANNHVK